MGTLSLVILGTIAVFVCNLVYRRALTEDGKWLDTMPAARRTIAFLGPTTEEPNHRRTEDVEQDCGLDWEIEESVFSPRFKLSILRLPMVKLQTPRPSRPI